MSDEPTLSCTLPQTSSIGGRMVLLCRMTILLAHSDLNNYQLRTHEVRRSSKECFLQLQLVPRGIHNPVTNVVHQSAPSTLSSFPHPQPRDYQPSVQSLYSRSSSTTILSGKLTPNLSYFSRDQHPRHLLTAADKSLGNNQANTSTRA